MAHARPLHGAQTLGRDLSGALAAQDCVKLSVQA